MAHGLPPDWPAAVINKERWQAARGLATLATWPSSGRRGSESPGLTIVGEVVRLREQLAWLLAPKPPNSHPQALPPHRGLKQTA